MSSSEKYFCVPDVHGMSDLLESALSFVYEKEPNGCKVIFLGDYIDRGPDNLGVLRQVMNPPPGYEFICLMGNHEQMFLDSLETGNFYDLKAAKEISQLSEEDMLHMRIRDNVDANIVEWMKSLKTFHVEDENVFAHAHYDDTRSPEGQNRDHCLWFRFYDDTEAYYNENQGYFLTHGHTPRRHGPVLSPNRVNLDCGAVFTGRLIVAEYQKNVKGVVGFHEFLVDALSGVVYSQTIDK